MRDGADPFSVVLVSGTVLFSLVASLSWVSLTVIVAAFALVMFMRYAARRRPDAPQYVHHRTEGTNDG